MFKNVDVNLFKINIIYPKRIFEYEDLDEFPFYPLGNANTKSINLTDFKVDLKVAIDCKNELNRFYFI